MKTYTVIGHFESCGEAFAQHYTAADPHDAIRQAAAAEQGNSDLTICGAIEGTHELIPACEDSGKIANAVDLMEQQVENDLMEELAKGFEAEERREAEAERKDAETPTPAAETTAPERISIIQWREWGEDEDTLTVTLSAIGEDVIQTIADEHDLKQDADGPGSIQVIGAETILHGQPFEYHGKTYRIRIEPVIEHDRVIDPHATDEDRREVQELLDEAGRAFSA